MSPPQTDSGFPGWVEDRDISTSPRPPLGVPHPVPGGWGLCPGPRVWVAAGSRGAQAAATAPPSQAAIPSQGGDRETGPKSRSWWSLEKGRTSPGPCPEKGGGFRAL